MPIRGLMTTSSHAPDWKVTPAHRFLVGAGWLLASAACFVAGAAIVADMPEMWGAVASLALVAMGIGLSLPEPVPHDMLTESVTRIRTDS